MYSTKIETILVPSWYERLIGWLKGLSGDAVPVAPTVTTNREYEIRLDALYLRLIASDNPVEQMIIGQAFTDLIRERNARRTPGEIAALEADKCL